MDEKLLVLFNRDWTGPLLDRVMAAASSLDLWFPFLVAGILWVAWRGGFRERAFLVCVAVALPVMDAWVGGTLKPLVNRPRPHQALEGVRIVDLAPAKPRFLALSKRPRIRASRPADGEVNGRSFPSSHTLNTFSVATLCALIFPRGWLAFLPAALVGYSRVYTGSHWPSDVLVSAMLSLGLTLLLAALLQRGWQRLGPARFPRLHAAHPSLFREGRA